MKMNKGIIAWRYAATASDYFKEGTFSKLPRQGTPEYLKIKSRQQEILQFWIHQATEHKYALTALRAAAQEQCLLGEEKNINAELDALNDTSKPGDTSEADWAIHLNDNTSRLDIELLAAKKCFQCFLPIVGTEKYDALRTRQLELIEEYTRIEHDNMEYDAQQASLRSTSATQSTKEPAVTADEVT